MPWESRVRATQPYLRRTAAGRKRGSRSRRGAIDEWPPETLDGDAISDLAHAVTDDTGIPMPFARENTNLSPRARSSREKPDFQASVIFRCAATPL